MFNLYSKALKVKILNYMELEELSKDDVLYHECELADNIYFVISGVFK